MFLLDVIRRPPIFYLANTYFAIAFPIALVIALLVLIWKMC